MGQLRRLTSLVMIALTATQGGCGVFAKRKPSSFVLTPPAARLDVAAATKPPTAAGRVVDGTEKTVIAVGLVAGAILFFAFEVWANSEDSLPGD